MTKDGNNPRGLSRATIAKIYVVYFTLFAMLSTLACFTVRSLINPTAIGLLAAGSVIIPILATWLHVRKGKRDRIDEIARKMP